jgi:hypothetical protein
VDTPAFVSLLCDDMITPGPATTAAVGIDAGITCLMTLSTGEKITNPRHERGDRARLAKAQRELSRKEKGSANRAKARLKVAEVHARITDRRRDYLHKLTTRAPSPLGRCAVAEEVAKAAAAKVGPGHDEDGGDDDGCQGDSGPGSGQLGGLVHAHGISVLGDRCVHQPVCAVVWCLSCDGWGGCRPRRWRGRVRRRGVVLGDGSSPDSFGSLGARGKRLRTGGRADYDAAPGRAPCLETPRMLPQREQPLVRPLPTS